MYKLPKSRPPARKYAEGTSVTAEKSRQELETLLRRQGAAEFAISSTPERTVFIYRLHGRMIKHVLEQPKDNEIKKPLKATKNGTPDERKALLREAEWRRRWRALVLLVKARFEYIDLGSSSFEREFLADTLLPDGQTVSEAALPAIANSYQTGGMPRLLGG